jgi:hypothetical protein
MFHELESKGSCGTSVKHIRLHVVITHTLRKCKLSVDCKPNNDNNINVLLNKMLWPFNNSIIVHMMKTFE